MRDDTSKIFKKNKSLLHCCLQLISRLDILQIVGAGNRSIVNYENS